MRLYWRVARETAHRACSVVLVCARGACAAARLEQVDTQQVGGVRTVLDGLAKDGLAHSGWRTLRKGARTAPLEASTLRRWLSIEVEQMLRRSPQVVHAHEREQLHPPQRAAAQPYLMDDVWHRIGADLRRSGLARRASGKRGRTWEVLKGRGLARRLRAGTTYATNATHRLAKVKGLPNLPYGTPMS